MSLNVSVAVAALLAVILSVAAVGVAVLLIWVIVSSFRSTREALGAGRGDGVGYDEKQYLTSHSESIARDDQKMLANSRSTKYLQDLATKLEAENRAAEKAFFGAEPDWNGPNVTSGKADPNDHEFAAFKLQQERDRIAAEVAEIDDRFEQLMDEQRAQFEVNPDGPLGARNDPLQPSPWSREELGDLYHPGPGPGWK